MERNEQHAEHQELLPGLKEAERSLNRLLPHSGGTYTERDEGKKEGIEAALNNIKMLINQEEASEDVLP